MKQTAILLFSLATLFSAPLRGADVVWFDGQHAVTYQVVGHTDPVVQMALQMFCEDMRQVTGHKAIASRHATIRIEQGKGSDDGFRLSVNRQGQIVI